MKYDSKHCIDCVNSKKLILICDLDETLLSSIFMNFERLKSLNIENLDINDHYLSESYFNYIHTKLRPHLKEFLTEMSNYFELHMMSLGNKEYVNHMLSKIDPDKRFFGDRIVCEDEIQDNNKREKVNKLFPDGDNIVCVIDDTEQVWKSYPNLSLIKRYSIFQAIGCNLITDQLLQNESTKDIIKKSFLIESDKDNYLVKKAKKLLEIHKNYFAELQEKKLSDSEQISKYPTVGNIMETIRISKQVKKKNERYKSPLDLLRLIGQESGIF